MKNQNKNAQNSDIFTQMLEGTQLAEATELDIAINDDVCVIHKAQMTALEAFADDGGEIVVTESEYQKDINDVSPGIISVLVASGVCIAELDELIMDEEIVYGA